MSDDKICMTCLYFKSHLQNPDTNRSECWVNPPTPLLDKKDIVVSGRGLLANPNDMACRFYLRGTP